jgi:hypothetical protein
MCGCQKASAQSHNHRDWGITQFIFGGGAEKVARKLWEEVLAYVRTAGLATRTEP